jgi:hypothetical protein
VVIDSQPKDAPDGPLVVVTSTICPVSSAVPRLVLFPSESGGKRMPEELGQRAVGRVFVCRKGLVVAAVEQRLGREGRFTKLVTERGSRAVSRAVDMAAKSKGRHKVGSRTGLERPMTARYGKAVVKIWQLEPFPAVGPLRALERVRNKRRLAILIGLLQDEG